MITFEKTHLMGLFCLTLGLALTCRAHPVRCPILFAAEQGSSSSRPASWEFRALQTRLKFDEALDVSTRWVEAEPQSAEAHAARGEALLALNRVEEAQPCLDQALKLKPLCVRALGLKVMALVKAGQNNEAHDLVIRARQEQAAMVLAIDALFLTAVEDYEGALTTTSLFSKLNVRDPSHIARALKALIYLRQQEPDEALLAAEPILKDQPHSRLGRLLQSLARLGLKQYDAVLKEIPQEKDDQYALVGAALRGFAQLGLKEAEAAEAEFAAFEPAHLTQTIRIPELADFDAGQAVNEILRRFEDLIVGEFLSLIEELYKE